MPIAVIRTQQILQANRFYGMATAAVQCPLNASLSLKNYSLFHAPVIFIVSAPITWGRRQALTISDQGYKRQSFSNYGVQISVIE